MKSKSKKLPVPVRINLSFTQDEFDCIVKYANELDLSLSGFIYANMKLSSFVSRFLGHQELNLAYLKLMQNIYETLEKSKKDDDDVYFEACQQLIEFTSEMNQTMSMALKLHNFGEEWNELRLLK